MKKVRKIFFIVTILLCFGFVNTPTAFAETYNTLRAWSESKLKRYAEDNILYYDNDFGCEAFYDNNGNFITNPDEELTIDDTNDFWDGHCSGVSSYNSWLNAHASEIISVARSNGLPWEAIMAQTIQESSGGKKEVCPFNPLGLKTTKAYPPACDGRKHATFKSYSEAFEYYVNSIIPVREAKNKYPNDPYKYIYFIQHNASHHYAASQAYTNNTSALVCGIQKWAETHGYQTSNKTYRDYPSGLSNTNQPSSDSSSSSTTTSPDSQTNSNTNSYEDCKRRSNDTNDSSSTSKGDISSLQNLVKEWAWPSYSNPNVSKKPAYAAVIAKSAYRGDGCHGGGVDCGAFVYNLIHESGWDPNYPAGSTSVQLNYLRSHWQSIGNAATVSENQLQPGDVAIRNGHVFIYVGNIPGFSSHTASASQCKRAPMAGRELSAGNNYLSKFTWYRKK